MHNLLIYIYINSEAFLQTSNNLTLKYNNYPFSPLDFCQSDFQSKGCVACSVALGSLVRSLVLNGPAVNSLRLLESLNGQPCDSVARDSGVGGGDVLKRISVNLFRNAGLF